MKVEPEYKSIGELFEEKNVFYTPKFQRDYSWESEQVEQFCKDIRDGLRIKSEGNDHQHFFGGIVCAQEEGVGNRKRDNILIDGQQRLSTIIMFFSVMDRYLRSLGCEDNDNEFRDEIVTSISKYLTMEERVQREKVIHQRIRIGRADNEFYQSAILGTKLQVERDSHDLIWASKERFDEFIVNELLHNKTCAETLDIIDNIVSLFEESFLLIHIISTTVDDAYKLFMVLNDRGINLTEGELLKAHTIGNADGDSPEVIQISQDWDLILANDSKRVSDYLRWIIIMVTGTHVTSTEVLEKYKEHYFNEEAPLNEMAKKVRFVREACDKLKLLSESEWPFEETQVTTQFHKVKLEWLVKKLKHTHSMPVLLAATYGKEKEFQFTVTEICKFFIRYKVISNLHASIFASLYPALSNSIFSLKDRFKVQVIREKFRVVLEQKDGDNEFFKGGIRSLVYKRKGDNRPIKYLLVTIQENWDWVSSTPELSIRRRLEMENRSTVFDFNNTTLEHLYPYSARAADIEELLEDKKNKIGNLVMLDLNTNRSNGDKTYQQKLSNFDNTGIGIHQFVLTNTDWDGTSMESLTNKYIEYSIKAFSF